MSRRFTLYILIGMALGLAAGAAVHAYAPDPKAISDLLSLVTDIFLRLIKMIIAPLVLSTLIAGIAHMGDGKSIGRVGAKALGWFVAAGVVSLIIGMVMVELFQPGAGLKMAIPAADAAGAPGVATSLSLKDFLNHVVPASVADAMSKNEILQIVVFSVFAGVATAAVGEPAKPFLAGVEALAAVMLKITNYVMLFAPVAVFAAIAASVATQGLEVILTYAKFVGGFYVALAILWAVLLAAGASVVGFGRVRSLFGMIRQPALLAFSTASSEAAYPRTLEELERFGVSKRLASFVLPLGYSFNLDGSMMYCTFASLFIAQVYGVHLTMTQRVLMLLLFLVTSKGIAGVPRASLVVIAATLPYFHIPEAGLLLVLGVDHFLDMGRSATNVIGNSVASAVVAKWEGELSGPVAEPALNPS
ncbi:dicarboxylate/amino acid:cation symporter [soil metagenome]